MQVEKRQSTVQHFRQAGRQAGRHMGRASTAGGSARSYPLQLHAGAAHATDLGDVSPALAQHGPHLHSRHSRQAATYSHVISWAQGRRPLSGLPTHALLTSTANSPSHGATHTPTALAHVVSSTAFEYSIPPPTWALFRWYTYCTPLPPPPPPRCCWWPACPPPPPSIPGMCPGGLG
jgi:hypothetical protein